MCGGWSIVRSAGLGAHRRVGPQVHLHHHLPNIVTLQSCCTEGTPLDAPRAGQHVLKLRRLDSKRSECRAHGMSVDSETGRAVKSGMGECDDELLVSENDGQWLFVRNGQC